MTHIRTYTADFKRDAICYVEEHPDIKIQDAANYLAMPKDTLYGWVKDYRRQKRAGNNPIPTGPLTDSEKEVMRLQRENRDLKDALEVLKKAISILND